jgi:hypothetical protein
MQERVRAIFRISVNISYFCCPISKYCINIMLKHAECIHVYGNNINGENRQYSFFRNERSHFCAYVNSSLLCSEKGNQIRQYFVLPAAHPPAIFCLTAGPLSSFVYILKMLKCIWGVIKNCPIRGRIREFVKGGANLKMFTSIYSPPPPWSPIRGADAYFSSVK